MSRILTWLAIVAGSLIVLWLGTALVMVSLPAPGFRRPPTTLSQSIVAPSRAASRGDGTTVSFRTRDGVVLDATRFSSSKPLTVVFLHGVLTDRREYLGVCRTLRDAAKADTYALDLRGHGTSGGRPGDVTYRDQYESDLSDVLSELHREKPKGIFVLAGHSMGGGIVMRYAELREEPIADGYLLFAPHLGTSSPTTPAVERPLPPGEESPVKLDLPRIVGLLMLNAAGVHFFDGLQTLFFNVPPQFPIHAYTYRAMMSLTPVSVRRALTADRRPMLVIVGQNDEAFVAARYPAVIGMHPGSKTVVLPRETHDSIVHSRYALADAAAWLRANWPQ
jgi:pimeloyl-ACP methyl ester carboxylesterase